jgi:hypothetical protein
MSNINPYNIDGTYPVAGQDNDSQGFRDNFTNIRNNFSYAQSEIADLQAKAITTSALTGGTLNNNMSYAVLQNAQLFSPSYTAVNLGTVTGAITLDYSQGSVQKLTTNGPITLSFANWAPTTQFNRLVLWIYVSSTAHTLTVPVTSPGVTIGLNDVAGANVNSGTITFDQIGNYLFEFESIDNGTNIFINDLSRGYATLRDPNFYWNDSVISTLFVGLGGSSASPNAAVLSYAVAADAGRSTVVAAGQYSSVSVGNLTLANIKYATLDTGSLSGYNLTSARGNLQTGTITPVVSNDLLGYYNAVTYTGNGSANTFTQTSRIDMYATGSNVVYGLGGNIAFWTAKDGGASVNNAVYQAVGIENDQKTRIFGNLVVAPSSSSSTSSYSPASSSGAGTPGQMAWDQNYLYICTGANTWKRVSLSTF